MEKTTGNKDPNARADKKHDRCPGKSDKTDEKGRPARLGVIREPTTDGCNMVRKEQGRGERPARAGSAYEKLQAGPRHNMLRERTTSVVLVLDQHLAPEYAEDICQTHHLLLERLHVWTMQKESQVQSKYTTSQKTARNLSRFVTYNAIQKHILRFHSSAHISPVFLSRKGNPHTVKTAMQIVAMINHFADRYLSNGGGLAASRFLHAKISRVSAAMMTRSQTSDSDRGRRRRRCSQAVR